jgi:dihydrofolate synthase/folylpolyglutamate synthase
VDFAQARSYLSSATSFGIRLGLHRITRLVELLGNPERKLRCFHVAGTNGKGSVSAYCANILALSGHRVGVFTSPYLVRLTERIRVIDGRDGLAALQEDESAGEINRADFARVMTLVRKAVEQMQQEGYEHPTEFEMLTAAAFLHFVATGCKVVVLETGLGGRLDSTNVIRKPLACIITALGYDHTDRLGSTMAEIAAEKAGIIKSKRPVFLRDPRELGLAQEEGEAALRVIRLCCEKKHAPLHLIGRNDIEVLGYGRDGQVFQDRSSEQIFQTGLLGLYQPQNALLAARACQTTGLADPEAVAAGIAAARWPARMEILRQQPLILIDGAHNLQGCQALAETLAKLHPGRPVVYLAGMLEDKDYRRMIDAVLDNPACPAHAFVCVRPDNPRGLPAETLAGHVRESVERLHNRSSSGYNIKGAIYAADSPLTGAKLALRLAQEGHAALCAFGSLYLVGGLRVILKDLEAQDWTGTS